MDVEDEEEDVFSRKRKLEFIKLWFEDYFPTRVSLPPYKCLDDDLKEYHWAMTKMFTDLHYGRDSNPTFQTWGGAELVWTAEDEKRFKELPTEDFTRFAVVFPEKGENGTFIPYSIHFPHGAKVITARKFSIYGNDTTVIPAFFNKGKFYGENEARMRCADSMKLMQLEYYIEFLQTYAPKRSTPGHKYDQREMVDNTFPHLEKFDRYKALMLELYANIPKSGNTNFRNKYF